MSTSLSSVGHDDPCPAAAGASLLRRATGYCVVLACASSCISGNDPVVSGPASCGRPASIPQATGCAFLVGTVTNTRGDPLDGIEGAVRVSPSCVCREAILQIDERGIFSVTVYRTGGAIDTATGTVVVQATAAKYPRHVTGAPYFDTTRVLMRFAPIGRAPALIETRLRIPLPGSG